MAFGKKSAQEKALEVKFVRPAKMTGAAKAFLKTLQKKYETSKAPRKKNYIKSSSLKFNRILGGGWLRGRVYEMFGPESGGKTTWALDAIANAQRQYPDMGAFFVDVERSYDEERAAKLGVDIKAMGDPHIPENGDTAMDDVYDACMSGAFSVIVVDSVAGLETSEEVIATVGETKNKVGQSGRLMSVALKKIVRAAYVSDTAVIFINQMRDKPGEMFGPKETTPGGRALKFYSSARIQVRALTGAENKFMAGGEQVGHRIEMQVVKNKLGAPYRKATMDLYYFAPLDTVSELLELGIQNGVVTNTGTTRKQVYAFNGKSIAEGEDVLRKRLIEDHELRLQVMAEIEKVFVQPSLTPDLSSEEELKVLEKEDSDEETPHQNIL